MILCLGTAAEETFLHTLEALRTARVPFHALDLGQLALAGQLAIPLADPAATTFTLHGARYRLGDYQAAYVRLVDAAPAAPDARLRARMSGLLRALNELFTAAPIPTINPPLADISNAAKLFHALSLAALVEWPIPRSCLTGDAAEARAFIASCETGVIFKGASAVKTYATRYDPALHADRLGLLAASPVLFQEYIEGPDVRVHVVEDRVFAEQIASVATDYRSVRGNRYQPLEVPPAIAAGCAALTRASGIPFLGIDFKVQAASGTWFFLEANPTPGYEGYDVRADGAIARALVAWLTGPPRRGGAAAR